jgi:FtsZ-interacting cell division protein ZipA
VQDMGNIWLIVGIAVLILVVLLIIYFVTRRTRARRSEQQRERTREEFGAEYDRAARERGSEEDAESELRRRRGRVERQVRPLSDDDRQRYEERWVEAERLFVNNPQRSVEVADRTISDLLDERNLISDAAQSDEETEKNLGVLYPQAAEDYREARRIRARVIGRSADEEEGSASEATEEMREAIRRYRAVYERLVEG